MITTIILTTAGLIVGTIFGGAMRGLMFTEKNKISSAINSFVSNSKTIADTDKEKVTTEFNEFIKSL